MWILKWPHLHFAPWFKFCISQNKERNHSFTDLSSIYLICSTNQQIFDFLLQGLSLKAVIEVVSICVCVSLSLSSRATCAPLFDEQHFSLSLLTVRPVSIYDRDILKRFSLISIHFQRFGCTMPRKLKWNSYFKEILMKHDRMKAWLSYCLLDIGCLFATLITIATYNNCVN